MARDGPMSSEFLLAALKGGGSSPALRAKERLTLAHEAADYNWRRADEIGSLAARMAGSSPPTNPIPSA